MDSMLVRCKKCKGRFFADMHFCPHCGRDRSADTNRSGSIAALILLIVAAAVVAYMLRKSAPQPKADPLLELHPTPSPVEKPKNILRGS